MQILINIFKSDDEILLLIEYARGNGSDETAQLRNLTRAFRCLRCFRCMCCSRCFCCLRCLRTWSRDLGSFVAVSLLIIAPIASGFFMFGSCFIMQYLVYFLVCSILVEEERYGCFTLNVDINDGLTNMR